MPTCGRDPGGRGLEPGQGGQAGRVWGFHPRLSPLPCSLAESSLAGGVLRFHQGSQCSGSPGKPACSDQLGVLWQAALLSKLDTWEGFQ